MARISKVQVDDTAYLTQIETVADFGIYVRNLTPALVVATGITGEVYKFDGCGSVVKVSELDADYFLSLRRKHGCCGSSDQPMFEKVTEV